MTVRLAALRQNSAAAPRWTANFDRIFADRATEKPTSSTPRSSRRASRRIARTSCARRSAACCGASSFITTISSAGSKAIPAVRIPPAGAHERAQPRMAPSLQRRRDLDARQVGVSLVRGLGPGLSLRCAGVGRSRFRQGATPAHDPRVVHASQRPTAGLRMGVRRRQSAGARLGGLARLQSRA